MNRKKKRRRQSRRSEAAWVASACLNNLWITYQWVLVDQFSTVCILWRVPVDDCNAVGSVISYRHYHFSTSGKKGGRSRGVGVGERVREGVGVVVGVVVVVAGVAGVAGGWVVLVVVVVVVGVVVVVVVGVVVVVVVVVVVSSGS